MVNFNSLSNYSQYNIYGNSGYASDASALDSNKTHEQDFGSYFGSSRVEDDGECETCKNRKYIDGSDENVSYKSPTHISAGNSTAAVASHEGEHVSNAYSKAASNDGEVLDVSVSIRMATCPECGSTYAEGGTTRSTIRYADESNPYTQNQKSLDAANLIGSNLDMAV